MRGFMICSLLLATYCLGVQIKEKVGWICSMHGKKNAYRVLAGEPEGRIYLKYVGLDGRITLTF
jgi:hypothetical protein